MTKLLRTTCLAATVAATALISVPAVAADADPPARAFARIVKPLTLTRVADIDFGTIVVQDAGTVTMDQAGALSCTANLTCAASGTPAEYLVTGTNNQVVQVTKPDVTLTNALNPGTPLTLVLDGPDTFTLPNSGATGDNFTLGGSIAIAASTRDGLYEGDLAVEVEYQ